jgi:hypothetical protein
MAGSATSTSAATATAPPAEAIPDGEYGDDYYSRARDNQGSAQPYPEDDGRYETAQAPDFAQ